MMLHRWLIMALVINGCAGNLMGVGEGYSDEAIITDMSQQICRDANTPTEEVVRRVGTKTDLRETFKRKYLTPVVEGGPISEEQITQETMAYIRKIAADPKTDESKRLSIIRLNGKVVLELQNNVEALQTEIDGLWRPQVGWGLCTVTGLGVILVAATQISKRDMPAKVIVGSVGGLMTVGGGLKSFSVLNRKGQLETDMQTKQGMKQDWQELFKVK